MEKVRIYVEQITEGQVLLTDAQLAQFEQYYDMLIEKNKVMNLTAITEREEVILKHFIDSLALAGYVKMWEKPYKIIDVGTGAGFPGIPLKIAFPNLQVTLFDSLNKRIKFLQDVIEALNLNEISAVHGRAEEGARDKAMREKYDFVVSRAVANMAVLSEYCIPFVKVGGYFFNLTTENLDCLFSLCDFFLHRSGFIWNKVEKLMLPDSDISRSFVFIRKEKQTPKAYPRKA